MNNMRLECSTSLTGWAIESFTACYRAALPRVGSVIFQSFLIFAAGLLFSAASYAGAPVLINTTIPDAVINATYSANFMIGGEPAPTAVTVGGLPPGITAVHNGSGSVALAGTPTQTGNFSLGITANSAGGALNTTVPLKVVSVGTVSASAIGAAWYFSCAVVDGGVLCWGDNYFGQLGNGTTTSSSTPVWAVATGSGATSVSGGYGHSCAVVSGGVQCWGNNSFGQLGNGSLTNSTIPVQAISAGSGVTDVAVGGFHTCASLNGGARCWGSNSVGALGNGTTVDSTVPVQAIASASGATAVAAGRDHSCALVSGGVRCWGYNNSGQLGNGTTTFSSTPVLVIPVNSGVTALAGGQFHSCAVVSGGLRCWGSNIYGQLGSGTTVSSLVPLQVISAGSGVTAITVGQYHSCAVMSGGVRCWGSNVYGQLGDGTTIDRLIPVQTIAAGSGAMLVVAGAGHTCATMSAGELCWGYNSNGQLGNGNTTNRMFPTQTIAAGVGVTAITDGSSYRCAVVNGGVICWGYNSVGETGSTNFTSNNLRVQAIAPGSGVTAVAAGYRHTCAVVSGGVRCWGSNSDGQLGNGTTSNSSVPVQAIAAGSGVTAVAAGGYHTCAVMNGGLRCWGNNAASQLGDGSTIGRSFPVQAIAANSGVTGVAAGREHSCAVVSGGVKCWGHNVWGQLGNGTYVDSAVSVQAIAAGSSVTTVAAGNYHTCALIGDGMQCWGYNNDGELGNGSFARSNIPVQTIASGSGATALAAAGYQSCAVVGGGVRCWGYGYDGELGNGASVESNVPVQTIAAGSGATAVAVGGCAVVNNGLQCWGNNVYSEVTGAGTTSGTVTRVLLPEPVLVAPAPVLLGGVTASQTTVSGTSNQNGTLYWVIVASGSAAPTAAQIKARTNYAGVVVVASGSVAATANVQASGSLSGLSTSQDYVAYVVAADSSGNLSNVGSASIARIAGTGSCGAASGAIPSYLAPSSNLCASGGGSASGVTPNANNTSWTWSCTGTNAGSVASCSAPRGYNVTVVIESNPPGANGTVNPSGTTLRAAGTPVFISTNMNSRSTFSPTYRGCEPGNTINGLYYNTAPLTGDCIAYVGFVQKVSIDPPAVCGATAGSCAVGTVSGLITGPTASTWTCSNGSNSIGCSAPRSCAANAGIRLVGLTSNARNTSFDIDKCDGSNTTQSEKPIGLAASGTLYVATCTSGLNTYTISSSSSPVVFTALPANTRFSCKVEEQVGGVTVSTSQSVIIDTTPSLLRPQPDVIRVWRDTPTRIDVLRNDWLSSGSVADGIGSYTPPVNGTLTPVSVGGEVQQLLYTPNAGYVGPDSFTYQAQDGRSGTTGASTPVAITVLAPLPLPTLASSTATTTLAIDGAGSVDVTVTSNGVASGATQPTLRVTAYSRTGGSSSGLSARTTGRTLVSEFSTATVSDQLVFDQAEPDPTGTLDARSYRQSATADGDIVLEPISKSLILPESRLISAVSDILFTPARRVPYAPFWRGFSSAAAASFIDGSVASADALPDTPGKYLQEMLSSHALGIAPQPASFTPLPAGSTALGTTGDFSATDVMIGDGDKRVGLISQLQGHSVYGSRLQGPEMIGALNALVDGATLITGTWASVPALSGVTLSQVHQSLMSAYRTHGHRRGFANMVRYVREVNTAALDSTTQSIRTRLLAELAADEYFTLPGGAPPSAPLSGVTAVISGGVAADQVAMHLLKVAAQNELLRQLLDADGAKLLLQDLLVEMLAEGPYSANFLRYLPTMKVYTMERYLNTAFSPAQLQFRLQQTTGAARYSQLLGLGRNQ